MTAVRTGLSSAQFWDMTQREIALHVRGFHWRMELEDWRTSRIVAAVYDVQRNPKKRRKPITARDFMPKKPGARTAQAQKSILDALVHRTRNMRPTPSVSKRRTAPSHHAQ